MTPRSLSKPPRSPRPTRAPAPPLIEVEVDLDRSDDRLRTLLGGHGVRSRLTACRPLGSGRKARLVRWVDLEAPPVDLDRLIEALEASADPHSVSVSTDGSDRAMLRLAQALPEFCAAVFASGGACVTCPMLHGAGEDGSTRARVLVPRNGEASRFARELARRRLGPASIQRTGPYRPRAKLTARQESALRAAFELGFFAYPRRSDLSAVARRLGVGRSATLELLRRAISELAARRYDSPDPTRDRL